MCVHSALLIVILAIGLHALPQQNITAVEIIKNVLEYVFAGKTNILYLRSSHFADNNMNHYVDTSLMSMTNKVYLVADPNNRNEEFKSTAHVVVFNEYLKYYNHLREHVSDHILGENIRVVIFIEGNHTKYAEYFEDTYPIGTEITFISPNPTQSKDTQQFSGICIHLLWKKRSFCVNRNTSKLLLAKMFASKSWRPTPKQTMTVQTFNCPPFVQYDERQQTYTGIEYNILQEVTKNWPLNLNIINASDPFKSKWSLAIDSLLEGNADMAMCSMWLTLMVDLLPNVSITYPFIDTCVTLVVPKPQVLPDVSYVFQPVQLNLWILLMFLVPIMSLVLRVFSQSDDNLCSFAFVAIRLLTVGSSAMSLSSKQRVLRYVVVSFSLTSLLLSTAYSAGFISLLTYPRLVKPVLYLEDVVKMNVKIDTEIPDVGKFAGFFRKFENLKIQKMADLLVSSTLEEYRTVDTKDFARIVKLIGKQYVTDTETFDDYKKTHLRLLKECLFEAYSTFAMQRHSRYSVFFNKILVQLNEHGFITHWYRESTINPRFSYMNNFFSSYIREHTDSDCLTISKLKGAFFVLGIGLVISLIAFIYETQQKSK